MQLEQPAEAGQKQVDSVVPAPQLGGVASVVADYSVYEAGGFAAALTALVSVAEPVELGGLKLVFLGPALGQVPRLHPGGHLPARRDRPRRILQTLSDEFFKVVGREHTS